jgi:chromosome condensin MukBEF MukE localization factor
MVANFHLVSDPYSRRKTMVITVSNVQSFQLTESLFRFQQLFRYARDEIGVPVV